MVIRDPSGTAPVYKPTGWMSNSPYILEELNQQCINNKLPPDQRHRHASLEHGRARQAQVYPEQLCYSILRGLRRHMVAHGLCHVGSVGTVCEDVEEHEINMNIQQPYSQFYDNISGKPLNSKLVQQARAEEISGACGHEVWTKVPTSEAKVRTGRAP